MARRRKIKKHTASKIIIAVVVILLIVAIALGIFYAGNRHRAGRLHIFAVSRRTDHDYGRGIGIRLD